MRRLGKPPFSTSSSRVCSARGQEKTIGRIVGPEAMKFGWQRLNGEYAKQFGVETHNWPPKAGGGAV
jgi:hypothetical protein